MEGFSLTFAMSTQLHMTIFAELDSTYSKQDFLMKIFLLENYKLEKICGGVI